jgi:alpha-D-xyloside xylohydrolase
MAARTYFDDYTIMRAMVMDFPDDQQVLNNGSQFMFGPSILVAPVTQYKARTWSVYLPKNEAGWFDFHTGKYYDGGQTIDADAPLTKMPLFIKAGAIIPAGPEMQYTAEKPTDPTTLYVYGGADATIDLYNDEAVNYNYQNGQYERIKISYNDADKSLTIGAREGTYPGMLQERTFEIVWIDKTNPKELNLKAVPGQTVHYNGSLLTIQKETKNIN